ncbi:MAG: adenosylcobinamide-GDP ribazoletransferase [Candidatus Methanofastidiosia archaeon]
MFFFLAVWQRYCCKKIGGITGDVLGATVKICETIVLIGFLII